MIDDIHEEDDEQHEPVSDAESQALADERAREAKYGEPKLSKGGELPDEGLDRIKPWAVKTAKALLFIVPVAIVGGVAFAAKSKKPSAYERDVMRPGKAAEAPSELIGLEAAQKREQEAEARKYERKPDDDGLPDSTLTAVGMMPDAGTYDDEGYAAGINAEQAKMCAEGDCKGKGPKYMGPRAAVRAESAADESFADEQPLPPLEVWGKKQAYGQQAPSTAPSTPPLAIQQPGIPPGLGEALAKAAGQQQTNGDGDDIKEAFAARAGSLDSDEVERDLGECELTAGTPITAAHVTALNTDVPAQASIVISVTQDVWCGGQNQHLAIPAGSTFTASANSRVTYGDNRIQICAVQLKRPASAGHPNGTLLPIKGCWAAVEVDGTPGLIADVDNHWSQVIGGVALSTVLALGTSAAAGNQEGFAPTIAQRAASQASGQMSQAGQRIVQRDLMRKPTLTRDMLQAAHLVVTTNQELEPWVPVARKRLRRF